MEINSDHKSTLPLFLDYARGHAGHGPTVALPRASDGVVVVAAPHALLRDHGESGHSIFLHHDTRNVEALSSMKRGDWIGQKFSHPKHIRHILLQYTQESLSIEKQLPEMVLSLHSPLVSRERS